MTAITRALAQPSPNHHIAHFPLVREAQRQPVRGDHQRRLPDPRWPCRPVLVNGVLQRHGLIPGLDEGLLQGVWLG